MSTARELIQSAYDAIGRGSELLSTDTSLLDKGLEYLQSIIADLEEHNIILENTANGVTTTIVNPATLETEVQEPLASRIHLINYLATFLLAPSRTRTDRITVPPASFSFDKLSSVYRVHVIPNKVPSKLLPRGQGHRNSRVQSEFFQGQALDNDVD